MWDSHGNGLQFWDELRDSGQGTGIMTGNQIHNNVFYNSLLGSIRLDDVVNSQVMNNVIVLDEEGGITGNAIGGTTISHNLFYFKYAWQEPTGSGYVTGDPLFVDPTGGNFFLREGSPAIDRETDVGLDYAGAGPDIGAHEYVPVSASSLFLSLIEAQVVSVLPNQRPVGARGRF